MYVCMYVCMYPVRMKLGRREMTNGTTLPPIIPHRFPSFFIISLCYNKPRRKIILYIFLNYVIIFYQEVTIDSFTFLKLFLCIMEVVMFGIYP